MLEESSKGHSVNLVVSGCYEDDLLHFTVFWTGVTAANQEVPEFFIMISVGSCCQGIGALDCEQGSRPVDIKIAANILCKHKLTN